MADENPEQRCDGARGAQRSGGHSPPGVSTGVRVEGFDGQTRDFYVRQLRDWKGSAEVESMVPAGLRAYGEVCGWTLARAHARSGDRIALAAYLGASPSFDEAVREFADAYADQNERDHESLLDGIRSGRITADVGV
jgi:hypothetical protein